MSIRSQTTSAGIRRMVVVFALTSLVGCGSDRSKSSALSVPRPAQTPLSLLGIWGGDGIRMTIEIEGAVIEYECGEGRIDEAIVPDEEGRFQAEGTFTSGGGADPLGGRPMHAAVYRGTVLGDSMELTGTLVDTAQSLGSSTLRLNGNGRFVACY